MQLELCYGNRKVLISGCVYGGDFRVFVDGLRREDVNVSMQADDMYFSDCSLLSWPVHLLQGDGEISINVEMDGESICIAARLEFVFASNAVVATDSSGSYVPCTIDWGYDTCPLVCRAAQEVPMCTDLKIGLVSDALEMYGRAYGLSMHQCDAVIARTCAE